MLPVCPDNDNMFTKSSIAMILKNKVLLTVVALLVAAGALFAQEPYTDLIYLKNGSVFKSRIIDYRQGDTITVEIAGGHILKFADSDIEKIQQIVAGEPVPPAEIREKKTRVSAENYRVKGGYGFGSMGFHGQSGGVLGSSAAINLEAGGGYQFNRFLGVGIGTGYDLFDPERGESVIPLYADYRLYPFKRNLGPYFNLALGYGFALAEESFGITDAKGGILFHPAIGWRVPAGDRFFFTFDLGARFQNAEFTQENQWWLAGRTVRDLTYRRTTFRFGIQMW